MNRALATDAYVPKHRAGGPATVVGWNQWPRHRSAIRGMVAWSEAGEKAKHEGARIAAEAFERRSDTSVRA